MELLSRSARPSLRLLVDKRQAKKVWEVRESALGAVAHVPGEPGAWEGWEDSAVAPEKLGRDLCDLRHLTDAYTYRCTLYWHLEHGCVHSRMSFDLESAEGIKRFRSFMEE